MTEKKEAEEREPANNVIEALNRVMGDVGYVQMKNRNIFHDYQYANEEDLLKVLRPALVEHGIVLVPSLDEEPTVDQYGNTNLVMGYTLAHVSGDKWPTKIRIPGCGNDRAKNGNVGDKGTYKALTGANKYLLFKLFQMATGEDPEVISTHEKNEVVIEPNEGALNLIDAFNKCKTTKELEELGGKQELKNTTSEMKLTEPEQEILVRNTYKQRLEQLKKEEISVE